MVDSNCNSGYYCTHVDAELLEEVNHKCVRLECPSHKNYKSENKDEKWKHMQS